MLVARFLYLPCRRDKRDWRDIVRGVGEVIDGSVCFSVGDEVQIGCQPTRENIESLVFGFQLRRAGPGLTPSSQQVGTG